MQDKKKENFVESFFLGLSSSSQEMYLVSWTIREIVLKKWG